MEYDDDWDDDLDEDPEDPEDWEINEALINLLERGELLSRCMDCGTYLSFQEAMGECPVCRVRLWPDRLVFQSVAKLPQC